MGRGLAAKYTKSDEQTGKQRGGVQGVGLCGLCDVYGLQREEISEGMRIEHSPIGQCGTFMNSTHACIYTVHLDSSDDADRDAGITGARDVSEIRHEF